MNDNILCSISTRGRYDTTLPLALQSIIMQTKKIDKLVIFDDNDYPQDVRNDNIYKNIFMILDSKGINWEWVFADKKGTHYNHQKANLMGYKWVWRMDDDVIAEPDVLEKLFEHIDEDVGAIGGSILTPPFQKGLISSGKIENINLEQNIQWDYIDSIKYIDHLHCSFLYRAGVYDYNLMLSKVAHREETLFTYGLKQRGYKILAVPCVNWHLKYSVGGIRDCKQDLFMHDERIFQETINLKNNTIVILDCGMGDHLVFKHMMLDIKNPIIFSCYPEIVPGKSIKEAKDLFGDGIEYYNIYRKMDEWNWKMSLEDAYRRLYVGIS